MGAPVAFFEILSRGEHERAQRFYADLFGWQIGDDPNMGGWQLVDTGAGETAIGGGIGPAGDGERPGVRVYLRVDDLDGYLTRAEELGGTRLMEPTDLPGDFGRI